jgi:hypothetical protein
MNHRDLMRRTGKHWSGRCKMEHAANRNAERGERSGIIELAQGSLGKSARHGLACFGEAGKVL